MGRRASSTRDAPARQNLPGAYRFWLAASLVSQLGDAALYFGLGWAASSFGGSAAGLVLSMIAGARTALLLLGGAIGDRAGAGRVMIAGDAVMLIVAVALGSVARWWGTPLPLLVVAGVVIGTVDAFYLPSLGSMPRRLVVDAQLPRAVAIRQSGMQLVIILGAPFGGALVALAGFAAAAWVDAASFAMVLTVLVVIRRRLSAPLVERRGSVVRSAVDGVRVSLRMPGLAPSLLLVAGAAAFIIPSTSLLVPLLARANHWNAANAGLIIGAQGFGVVASTLVVARRGSARRPGIAAACGLASTAAGMLLLAASGPAAASAAAAVVIGIGSGAFVSNLAPILLQTAPRTHLARVQSLLSLVQSSALLISDNALGAVSHMASASVALLCCAGGLTCCTILAVSTPPLRRLGAARAVTIAAD